MRELLSWWALGRASGALNGISTRPANAALSIALQQLDAREQLLLKSASNVLLPNVGWADMRVGSSQACFPQVATGSGHLR